MAGQIQAYTLSEATHRREALLDRLFNRDLPALNRFFAGEKKAVDTEAIAGRVNELRLVNQVIEQRKQENLQQRTCCMNFKAVKATTWVILGLEIAAWLGLSIYSIYDVATDTTGQRKARNITEIVVTITALFLTAVVGGFIKAIDDDIDKFRMLAQVSRIEQQGEKHFQELLQAFNDYKDHKEKPQLSRCIHCFDRLPEGKIRTQIPPRDQWIATMIQMLPEDHPVKRKFAELEAAAMAIFEMQEDEVGSPIAAASTPVHKHGAAHLIEVDDTPSSEDDGSLHLKSKQAAPQKGSSASSTSGLSPAHNRKFKGEKLPGWLTVPKKIKMLPKSMDSSPSPAMLETIHLEPQYPSAHIAKRRFQKEWTALERDLACTLNCVNLGTVWFDRDAHVAENLDALPNFIPEAAAADEPGLIPFVNPESIV